MSSSTTSSTDSLFTPLQFTGVSQYSSDMQSILTRAVGIAKLPLTALQNTLTTITEQEADLTTLGISAGAVGSALKALGNLSSGGSLTATSSDTNVVTATATGSAASASYNITNVTSLASTASEVSTAGYSDTGSASVSASGTIKLVNGNYSHTITLSPGQNNLKGVVAAINQLTDSGVTASIVNAGGTKGYYLSVSANSPGATTLKLLENPAAATPANLLTTTHQGSNTQFDLNGVTVTSAGTTVDNVIPGLTLKFTGTTAAAGSVNVNVATDPSQISSALQTLVSSYNALATQESAQMGATGGSLNGNNIIYQIRQAMSSIVGYQGSVGDMGNLANLGIEMSATGQMSFNQDTFDSLSSSQIASGLKLLGTATTGVGGLQQAFNQITDSTDGTITQQENQWKNTATNLTDQINTKVAQIQAYQQTLNQRLQAADALLANLASQQNVLTASITSLDYTSYGYNSNISGSKQT